MKHHHGFSSKKVSPVSDVWHYICYLLSKKAIASLTKYIINLWYYCRKSYSEESEIFTAFGSGTEHLFIFPNFYSCDYDQEGTKKMHPSCSAARCGLCCRGDTSLCLLILELIRLRLLVQCWQEGSSRDCSCSPFGHTLNLLWIPVG